jgi:hypothetical protein
MKTCLTFMIVSRWIIVIVRNVSDKMCRENQYTFSVTFFSKVVTFYEKMWKNMKKPDRPQIT